MRASIRTSRLVCGGLVLTVWVVALAAAGDAPRPSEGAVSGDAVSKTPAAATRSPDPAASKPEMRLREGTSLVEELGEFHDAGDRLVFQCQQRKTGFTVLENLSLERIWTVLGDSLGPRQWSVSGTITEFRGTNYLLITRAVLRSKRADYTPTSTPKQP